jgi:IPT/TIG domain
MSSFVPPSLFSTRKGRRRAQGRRTSRGFRIGLELLEDRITPTSVTALSPVFGPVAGGTSVTITGTGFTGVTAVDFGTTPAASDTVVSATTITAESPAGTGAVDVTVTAAGGTSPTSPADQYTYSAAPAVSAISPTAGPLVGGTLVTITGSGFTGATSVNFGTTPATNLTVVNDTTITADSPAGTGTVNVTVTTPLGTSAASSADQFTYGLAVSGLSPAAGPLGGGTLVTITGSGFTGATAVDFGTTPAASFTVNSATTITAASPAHTAGTVNVTVTTPTGTSPASPANVFAYGVSVTRLSPTAGPVGGGTLVTITGSGFTGATAVDFGTTPATNLTIVSSTLITVDSPAGTGAVNVTVTTPLGTSATSPADVFTYAAVPTVAALTPTIGSQLGGTMVSIIGNGFTGATTVTFGTTLATNLTVVSDSLMTVESPAGIGIVDVTVTTPGGTSATSPADRFTYAVGPAVSGLSPAAGPRVGGTLVTIVGSGFTGATAVDFGTAPATSLTVVSDTTLTVISPPGAGTVNVTVTTPAGTSAISPTDQFTYSATVTGLSPTTGPQSGGTLVTITGTAFTGATEVDFGTTPATNLTVVSDTSITVDSPPGTGTVNVTVTTPAGTSAASSADLFTYAVGPTVSGVSPSSGLGSGGTLVTITGSGFTGATAVNFGTAAVTTLVSASDTQLVVVSPTAKTLGLVDVTVTTPGGTSATSPADLFFYSALGAVMPRVSAISPKVGLPSGGTLVTITGSGFAPGASAEVSFGPTAATNVTVVSTTTITAVSPAGTGAVNVTVTTVGGPSNALPANVFTYTLDGPQVTSVQRFGFHAQPTFLVINFNGPLDPSLAQKVSNYRIIGPNGNRIRVKSAIYNSATDSVTLSLGQQLVLRKTYRLTVNGMASSGLTNPEGLLLDGAGTGVPGSNFVTSITQNNLAGSANQRPTAAIVKTRAKVDVIRAKLAQHRHAK